MGAPLRWDEDRWAEHKEICIFAYHHAPAVKGPYSADDAFEAWAHFGCFLNDLFYREWRQHVAPRPEGPRAREQEDRDGRA